MDWATFLQVVLLITWVTGCISFLMYSWHSDRAEAERKLRTHL